MEKVKERRKFIKGVGLFAALFAGGSAVSSANTNTTVAVPSPVNVDNNVAPVAVVEDVSHLAPPNHASSITINGAYGEKPKPIAYGNGYYIAGINQQITHSVTMTVGLDNRLWIKVDDNKWKRVALEG